MGDEKNAEVSRVWLRNGFILHAKNIYFVMNDVKSNYKFVERVDIN
jgi:hypothetical protein